MWSTPSASSTSTTLAVGVGIGLVAGYLLGHTQILTRKRKTKYHVQLLYWDMPGRAEAIRLAFHLGGIEFEDVRVSRGEFERLKADGELPFGQFPVMLVDGVKFAQSTAMLRFAGQITGLYPSNPVTALRCDMICDSIQDLVTAIVPSFEESDEVKKMEKRSHYATEVLPYFLRAFEGFLEESPTEYFLESGISICDLWVSRFCQWFSSGVLDGIPSTCMDPFPLVKGHLQRMEDHPQVQDYYNKFTPSSD